MKFVFPRGDSLPPLHGASVAPSDAPGSLISFGGSFASSISFGAVAAVAAASTACGEASTTAVFAIARSSFGLATGAGPGDDSRTGAGGGSLCLVAACAIATAAATAPGGRPAGGVAVDEMRCARFEGTASVRQI